MIRAGGVSDPGPARSNNEDAFVCLEAFNLFLVADGMGGHAAGEVASKIACEAVEGFIRRSDENDAFTWPYGLDPSLSYGGNRLRTALLLSNRRVLRASEAHDDYAGMGTTIVAVLIADGELTVAHVGDSRLYRAAGGELIRLTEDDSWAEAVLKKEQHLDEASIIRHPMSHALTNVLGSEEQVDVHVGQHALAPGDRLLLCSDGIHGVLHDDALLRLLTDGLSEPETIARAIVDAALAGGTRDNVTALVVCVDEV
jgi:PPM family protein phosphatase